MWSRWVTATLTLAALVHVSAAAEPSAAMRAFDHEHAGLRVVLSRHVRDGRVDYAALLRDRAPLDRYVEQLARVPAALPDTWSRAERLAFWINAYNAQVLRTVIDHYPIRRGSLLGVAFPANSIWQIPGAFRARRLVVAERRLSLDDIEHRIIRPTFGEPRVHVALVCAARSCPVLRAEPFVATRLDVQLDEQSRRFAADRAHGLRPAEGGRGVRVSSIFKWFAEDFAVLGGGDERRGVLAFLARHSTDPELLPRLREASTPVDHLDYDWTLNDVAAP